MKPDQHKQKRSSQYKKKHGITNNTDSKAESSSNRRRVSTEERKSGSAKKTEIDRYKSKDNQGQNIRNPSQSNNCNDDEMSPSSDDSDCPSSSLPRKTFRRREIVSNWQRYEMPEKEQGAEEEILGEDFNKLLSLAGSAVSQFRFRDEQDWLTEGDGNVSDEAGLLAVNTEQISAALQCIPLYEVLRLEKNLFSAEQIESIDVTAKMCKDAFSTDNYSSNLHHSKLPSSSHDAGQTTERTTGIKQSNPSSIISQKTGTKVDLDSLLEGTKRSVPPTKHLTKEISEIPNKPVNSSKEEKVSSNDKDDGELDFLLSLEKPVENVSSTQKSPAETETRSTKESTQELEDWLDSVLEA